MWSERRQCEEFRRSESQVRLLSQGPLGALAAGRRHHQDPLQKRSQWLVERRGVRPGEGFANTLKKKTFTGIKAFFLICTAPVSRWGSFQPTMWRRTTLNTADVAPEMCRPCMCTVYTTICTAYYTVWVGSMWYLVSNNCINPYARLWLCVCVCVREVMLRRVMWIKYLLSWSDEHYFLWTNLERSAHLNFHPHVIVEHLISKLWAFICCCSLQSSKRALHNTLEPAEVGTDTGAINLA